jgi:hypothetical protein
VEILDIGVKILEWASTSETYVRMLYISIEIKEMEPPIFLEEIYLGSSIHLTYELLITVSFRHSLQPGPSYEGEKKFNLKNAHKKLFKDICVKYCYLNGTKHCCAM